MFLLSHVSHEAQWLQRCYYRVTHHVPYFDEHSGSNTTFFPSVRCRTLVAVFDDIVRGDGLMNVMIEI